jgi:glutathione S-transferase
VALRQIERRNPALTLVDGEVVLSDANAISMHLGGESKIFGRCWEEEIEVYSWMEYYNREVYLLITEIEGQILGRLEKN